MDLYGKDWELYLDLATTGFISWRDSYFNHLHRAFAKGTKY